VKSRKIYRVRIPEDCKRRIRCSRDSRLPSTKGSFQPNREIRYLPTMGQYPRACNVDRVDIWVPLEGARSASAVLRLAAWAPPYGCAAPGLRDEQLDANELYPQNGPLRVHVALGDDVYEPSPMVFQLHPGRLRQPQPALSALPLGPPPQPQRSPSVERFFRLQSLYPLHARQFQLAVSVPPPRHQPSLPAPRRLHRCPNQSCLRRLHRSLKPRCPPLRRLHRCPNQSFLPRQPAAPSAPSNRGSTCAHTTAGSRHTRRRTRNRHTGS
jgi:hypothetical protein